MDGEESQKKGMASLAQDPKEKDNTENPPVVLPEVEYIESEDLKDVEDVDDSLKSLLPGLGSKDWISVCDALNNVRRFTIFHKEAIVSMLPDIISLVEKSLKNSRSAVCKTATMTLADIFKAYKDDIIDSVDPLLVQLLLKSSQDKKFVCEAAESALVLLPKLQPFIDNRNPCIGAKAYLCISRCVTRLVSMISEVAIREIKIRETSLAEDPKKKDKTENPPVVSPEVEYIESEDLKDVEDVDDSLKTLLPGLGSKDWVSVCDALNNVRRFTIFHKEAIVSMLPDIISLVEKSLKNSRSAYKQQL